MLLDPTTFETLAERLSKDADTARSVTSRMPTLPDDNPMRPIPLERTQVLLSFGLTERDLEFMGYRERGLVNEVVDRVLAVQSLV